MKLLERMLTRGKEWCKRRTGAILHVGSLPNLEAPVGAQFSYRGWQFIFSFIYNLIVVIWLHVHMCWESVLTGLYRTNDTALVPEALLRPSRAFIEAFNRSFFTCRQYDSSY